MTPSGIPVFLESLISLSLLLLVLMEGGVVSMEGGVVLGSTILVGWLYRVE